MAVLETSFLIDILRNRPSAVELLYKLEQRETFLIASPTVMELWEGALRNRMHENEKSKVENLLSAVAVLNFDVNAAKQAAEINVELSHEMIEPEDVMIAAIALSHGEMLVTRDEHFTRIKGLRVLKY